MITFADQSLFDSGPHALHQGPLAARLAEHNTTGSPIRVTRQGREAQTLTQIGTLLADSLSELLTLTLSIESLVSGPAGALDDGIGRRFLNTILTQAEFKAPQSIGPRFRRDYRLTYHCLTP